MTRGKLSAMCAALLLHGVAFGGWAYRSTLTVSGYSGSETLSGFPVLVRLSPQTIPGFAYRDCKVANGGDLRFTSLDGNTVYPHEVDEWNEDGESLVWVKLPSLPSGGTSFYLQYGNPDAPTPADGSAVWSGNAGGNYAGVWHMNEQITSDIAAATASHDSAKRAVALGDDLSMDATPKNANTAQPTAESLREMVSTNGVVGRARVNASDASNSDSRNRLLTNGYSGLGLGTTFAYSGWFLNRGTTTATSEVISRKSGWQDSNGFQLMVGTTTSGREVKTKIQYRSSSSDLKELSFDLDPRDIWVHYAVVCDGTSHAIYVNGVKASTETCVEVVENSLGFSIGGRAGAGAGSLLGQYDEVRLMDAVPGDDWVAAAYATMANPNFVTATAAVLDETDVLDIRTSDDMTGVVPACGLHENLADGEEILCTAPDEAETLTETSRRRFAGWSLYQCDTSTGNWLLVDSAETNQLRYVHVGGSSAYRLVWKVACEYRHNVSVSPSGFGTVTAGGNTASGGILWAEEGAVVTAVPDVGKSFTRWTGTGLWTDETQPSFTLDTTEHQTFTANFYASDPSAWSYVSKLAVKPHDGTETLVGFPVLVRISSERIEGFDYGMCQAGGGDLRFMSADGSVTYPHEIDEWNTDGESLVWVKLPSLPPEGASLQMLFGNTSAPSREDARAVWSGNAGGNYAGVWHMNEIITAEDAPTTVSHDSAKRAEALGVDLSMDATPLKDYTAAAAESLAEMVSTNGVVGRGRVNESSHTGNSGTYNQRLSVAAYDALEVGGTFAVSGWFHSDVTPISSCLVNHRENNDSDPGFFMGCYNNSATALNFGGGQNRTTREVSNVPSIVDNWLHVACVFDGSTYRCYVNGVLKVETTDELGVEDTGKTIGIGGRGSGGYNPLVGQYDEVRLLDAVPSAEWVKAAYDTMAEGSFVTGGAAVLNEPDVLSVVATEEMPGLEPAVGLYHNLADGQVVDCVAPDAAESLTETSRRRYFGWSLYRSDATSGTWTLVDSAKTNQLRYVHVAGTSHKLVWNARREYRHNVTTGSAAWGKVVAGDGDSVAAGGFLWAAADDVVTAVPSADCAFVRWTGTGPWTDATQPSFTLNTTEPLTFSAAFYKTSPSGWLRASTMTVKPTGGEETLVGFPVLVRISPERIKGFDYAMCQAGGADIRFVSPDGSVTYPHEIDEWNADGESLAWVKLPSLPPEGASFQMLFGNPFAPVQENARAVWSGNAGGNYAGVWHMNEQITSDIAAATASRDSAKRAAALGVELSMDATPLRDYKDTTSESLGEMVSTNGVVGRARVNESSSSSGFCAYNQRLSVPNYDGLNVGSSFSISGWFHSDVTPRSCQILNRKSSWQTGTAFNLQTGNNNDNSFSFSGGDSTSYDVIKLPSIVAGWVHVALVCDGTTLRLYVNGTLEKEVTDAAAVQDNGELLGIGARGTGGNNALVGQYDEVRLLDAVPSSNWVAAAYATMTDPEFVTARRARPPAGGLVIMVR